MIGSDDILKCNYGQVHCCCLAGQMCVVSFVHSSDRSWGQLHGNHCCCTKVSTCGWWQCTFVIYKNRQDTTGVRKIYPKSVTGHYNAWLLELVLCSVLLFQEAGEKILPSTIIDVTVAIFALFLTGGPVLINHDKVTNQSD